MTVMISILSNACFAEGVVIDGKLITTKEMDLQSCSKIESAARIDAMTRHCPLSYGISGFFCGLTVSSLGILIATEYASKHETRLPNVQMQMSLIEQQCYRKAFKIQTTKRNRNAALIGSVVGTLANSVILGFLLAEAIGGGWEDGWQR